MEPYELLTEDDKETLLNYVNYVGEGCLNDDTLLDFLTSWNTAKKALLPIFGNQLTIHRTITYETPRENVKTKIQNVNYEWAEPFANKMWQSIKNYYFTTNNSIVQLGDIENRYDRLWVPDCLAANELIFQSWASFPIDIPTPQGNRVRLSAGAKPMRLIGKLARAFGYEKEYEEFRLEISRCLNTSHLEGELYLSIHPMDYITMSDNACGWHSCMAWTNDGEYKLGTLEMLGSPYCVVAYLAAKESFDFNGYYNSIHSWNNKKWRQLLFIHPAFIAGNRHYPYDAEGIEAIAMSWLRELAEAANFSKYHNEVVKLKNGQGNRGIFNLPLFSLHLTMDQMYNDLNENNYYLAENFEDYLTSNYFHTNSFSLNLSGVAHCVACGHRITSTPDPRYLRCEDCIDGFYCACCGDFIVGDSEYTNSNGDQFCYYCFNDCALDECDICDEYFPANTTDWIDIEAPNGDIISHVKACNCCSCSNEITRLFGDFNEHRNFNALEVSEEGHYVLADRYKDFSLEDCLFDE